MCVLFSDDIHSVFRRLLKTVSGAWITTRVSFCTELVRKALPPTTLPRPMTVSPPRMEAPE